MQPHSDNAGQSICSRRLIVYAREKIVAMLLAGGQGSRLGELTKSMAKPAVPFGGKYRIIDFPLSNCVNSDIDTVGVLTQYEPLALNAYLGNGQAWDLDRNNGGVFVLPLMQATAAAGGIPARRMRFIKTHLLLTNTTPNMFLFFRATIFTR